ncbi:MAG TPA: DUF4350 domain-containing protein [Oculatellaceae cyanobacterium]
MPKPRTTLQIGVCVLLLFVLSLISIWLKPQNLSPKEDFVNRSIYNSAPSGSRAWYLAIKKSGIPVSLWEESFQELKALPGPATMLIIQPFAVISGRMVFDEAATQQLLTWVGQGNTLILLDDFQRPEAKAFIEHVGFRVIAEAPGMLSPSASQSGHALNDFVAYPLHSQSGGILQAVPKHRRHFTPLLRNTRNQPTLIQLPYQKGSLILGTSTDLIANQWLHKNADGNFQYLANLIQLEKKPLVINEFVHGYRKAGDIFAFFREKTPIGAIAMQLFFVFLLVLWLSFMRWTPVWPALKKQASENSGIRPFIDSLAGVYYRRHAAILALRPMLEQVATTLRDRYQIHLQDSVQIQTLLESLPSPYSSSNAETLGTLREAQELVSLGGGGTLPHRELLRIAQQLSELQERLRHAHQ